MVNYDLSHLSQPEHQNVEQIKELDLINIISDKFFANSSKVSLHL